jgi:hypothetical protein
MPMKLEVVDEATSNLCCLHGCARRGRVHEPILVGS